MAFWDIEGRDLNICFIFKSQFFEWMETDTIPCFFIFLLSIENPSTKERLANWSTYGFDFNGSHST